MSQTTPPSGSVIQNTEIKESEKPSDTALQTVQPKNPWIVIKLRYYEYVLPAKHLQIVLDIFEDIEELESDKIQPIDDNNNKATFRFMSQVEYQRMKANYVLLADQ